MKKRICLMTEWYPAEDNPFRGLFFKEQAFSVSDNFDFLVLHYREHLRINPLKREVIREVHSENNTTEFDVDVYMPPHVLLADFRQSVLLFFKKKSRIEGVGTYLSNAHKKYTRETMRRVYEANFRDAFDALYCVDAQLEAFFVQAMSEASGKSYVLGEHAPVPWPGYTISDANKFAIEHADLFLAISQDKVRQLLLQNIHLPEIRYVGNLIDERKLRYEPVPHHEKTFIIVAANSFYKNYDLFIHVMSRLKEISRTPFRVIICGYASNKGYSTNVEAFEERIRNCSFSDCVEMIPSVPHEEIGKFLNRADAFVMTSIQEGQPVSAMEAACCGLPVFSTRCGGVEDYIDEQMGRIYAVNDCEGMAHGLNAYLEGSITFDASYIRNQVIRKFGMEAFTKNFTDAFLSVIQ